MKAHFPDSTLPPVLIVDDCEDDVFLLRHRLREGGITNPIVAFEGPAEVLSYLHTARYEGPRPVLMFTDIRMPGGCGFELIASIRANPEWDDLRIAVATTSNTPSDLERAIELGANGYLIKFPPCDMLVEFVQHGPWFAVPRRTTAMANALSA